jgi:hypothetical protein
MANNKNEISHMNQAEVITPLIVSDQIIEPVVTSELGKTVAQESFMNEMVVVTIASTTDENAPPHLVLNVNGINQPFFRDQPTKCRRMFAEVLARCKETKYTQHRDPYELDRQELRERTALAYPFTMEDTNPKGQAWLRAVMQERN